MAVKPWIGAIKEPDNHPPVNKDAPDSGYAIDYVYGYRCQDSRQNVYFNPEGNIVYITACLGVILDKASNTQKFFGGGNVENKSKQVASDANHHNNDVMCMKINTNGNREWAVSGQVGKSPSIFVWNTLTGEKRQRMNLLKGSRAVAACAISTDLKYIACADKHNDHNVFVFEVDSGSMVYTEKGGPDEIFDMAFNMAEGQYDLWSAGMKHMTYWNIAEMKKKKCVFGENPRTSFAACTADDQGNCYAGGSNSLIYVWCKNSLKTTIGVHNRGFVGAIVWNAGKLYSGGKDGRICITDAASGTCENVIECGVLPRAIDVSADSTTLVVGLRTGSIVEFDLASMSSTTYMQSHNDGEVWGLDMDANSIYTTGDDNQVKKWDPFSRKCIDTAIVSNEVRKA